DLTVSGMAHAKVLRSPYAHARVRRVDVTRARVLPGVFAAIAGADLTWCDPYYGPAYRDRPVLAIDVARYEGEPVAAVAAVDEATAEAALELIDVDYEPLAPAMTLEEALAPGAPLVHTGQPPVGHFAALSRCGHNRARTSAINSTSRAATRPRRCPAPTSWSRTPTGFRPSSTWRSSPTRCSPPGTRRVGSRCGRRPRTRTRYAWSSRRCSTCRSREFASWSPISAVASAARPTRSSSPWRPPSRARPVGRCAWRLRS